MKKTTRVRRASEQSTRSVPESKPKRSAGKRTRQGDKKGKKAKRGFLHKKPTQRAIFDCVNLILERLDTPISLGIALRMKYGLWQEIAEYRLSPHDYVDGRRFRADYIAYNLLRKYPDLPIDCDREAAGLAKFRESEVKCKETNLRFTLWQRGAISPIDRRVESVLYRARSKIAWLLSEPDLNYISDLMRWGPGATSATRGPCVSAYHKFDAQPECTRSAIHLAKAMINSTPTWAQAVLGSVDPSEGIGIPCSVLESVFRFVAGNRIAYVPKDALIDRVILAEPHMNSMLQLGFGGAIRRALRRVGVDLDDQVPNQEAARIAAITGLDATVDSSSASDMIATRLVEFLTPPVWYDLLFMVRSPRGYVSDDELITYEKFSSMGNGYTFELESLIYWALCAAVLDEIGTTTSGLRIYGDDIVIPTTAYPLLLQVFGFAGFEINRRKSFSTGNFRESCGEHYFGEVNAKPVYFDSTPETVVELYGLINQVTALASRLSEDEGTLDKGLFPARARLISLLPPHDRFFGPLGVGDGVIVGSFDECSRFARPVRELLCEKGIKRMWVEGMSFLQFVPQQKKVDPETDAAQTWALYKHRHADRRGLKRHPVVKWMPGDDLLAPTRGRVDLRGKPVRFKLSRLEILDPQYIGVWT